MLFIPTDISCKYNFPWTIVATLVLILSQACEFRISDEDALSDAAKKAYQISFGDILIEDHTIHYAFSQKENPRNETMVILIHGSPGSWSAFQEYFAVDSLTSKIDMLAIDRPGFGESNFGQAETSLQKQAYLLNEVVAKFPHQSKILVGHSLGGSVIGKMAMDYPDHYDGLIFVAPAIDPKLEKEEWYRGVIDTKLGSFFTPTEFLVSNMEILTLKRELQKMQEEWHKINVKSIVLQGTSDMLVPKENADFAQAHIKDSLLSIRMIEGANHFIPWSHQEEIIKAIFAIKNDLMIQKP